MKATTERLITAELQSTETWKSCTTCKVQFLVVNDIASPDLDRCAECQDLTCRSCQRSKYIDAVSTVEMGDRYGKATTGRPI